MPFQVVVGFSGHASSQRAKRKATPAKGWPKPCWRSLKLNEASGCMACQTSQAASRSCSVGLSSRIGRLRLRQFQHRSRVLVEASVFRLKPSSMPRRPCSCTPPAKSDAVVTHEGPAAGFKDSDVEELLQGSFRPWNNQQWLIRSHRHSRPGTPQQASLHLS